MDPQPLQPLLSFTSCHANRLLFVARSRTLRRSRVILQLYNSSQPWQKQKHLLYISVCGLAACWFWLVATSIETSRTCRICDSYSPATETAEATVQNHLPNLPHLPLSNYFPLLNSSSIILKLTTLNTDYQLAKKLFCHRTIATKPNLCHSLTRITYLLNQNHPPASILLCPNTLHTLFNTHRLKPIYYSKTFLNYCPKPTNHILLSTGPK